MSSPALSSLCKAGSISIGPGQPLALIAGPCVLESLELGLTIGRHLRPICDRLGINYIFKASFDKANRSSIASPRGPGIDKGLAWLKSQHLSFPDDGRYSVNNFDPAAEPIDAALIAIEWLHAPATGNAVAVADAPLREAVTRASKDDNQEVQQRAKSLLAKLGS